MHGYAGGFVERVVAHAQHRHALPAATDEHTNYNWRQFNELISRYSGALASAELKPGDRVGLIVGSSVDALALSLAALARGGVLVPFSGYLKVNALLDLARDASISFLLSDGSRPDLAGPIALELELPREKCWHVGTLAGYGDIASAQNSSGSQSAVVPFDPQRPFNIIYSSGTTSAPKGIVLTNATRMATASILGQCLSVTPSSVTLVSTPLSSNGAWIFMLPGILVGGQTVFLSSFSAQAWLDAVEDHNVTHAFLVPTQLKAVVEELGGKPRHMSTLRSIVCGGSRCDPSLKLQAAAAFPNAIFELYGLTEGVATLLYPREISEKPNSVGRPLSGGEFKVIGDDDRPRRPDEIGELVGRGPPMMAGYLNRPEANAEISWQNHDGKVFLRTGDIGRIDEDGFVYVVDRKKDMIVSGGLNVFAADIEVVLLEHPDVQDAAVIAVPDEKWGETPFAFIVQTNVSSASAEEILAWTNSRVGKHQRLSGLSLRRSDFPRNALGKVLKKDLRAEHAMNSEEKR